MAPVSCCVVPRWVQCKRSISAAGSSTEGNGMIVAVHLQKIASVPGVIHIQGDITKGELNLVLFFFFGVTR